jgi:hypothetical protein
MPADTPAMLTLRVALLASTLLAVLTNSAVAEPLAPVDVPEPLRPWIDWVLRDDREAFCPLVHSVPDRTQCAWPSRLQLDLQAKSGSFRQEWVIHHESWVPLPGDGRLWPQDVQVNGAAEVVTPRAGRPGVRLKAGRHRITGRFRWSALPELIAVPPETGLLSLVIAGQPVAFPKRDAQGRLWVQKRLEEETGESRLDLNVQRRVIDEIPLRVETRLELRVSGKNREAWLGPVLPKLFVPMSLHAPLPARIEPDGRVRVQVRPGTWQIQLEARHEGPAGELSLPEVEGSWDPEEIWVFEARSHLRLVDIEGVPQIDPQQTQLPDAWKHLPAYLMRAGSSMRLVEKQRGDAEPAPDQLALQRTWWLDFDGRGYTVHDEISGSLRESWRLEMGPRTELGRVAIEGHDQFISRLDDSGLAGVEVRQGQIRLDADSRLNGDRSTIPAVGWNHDFQQVSGRFYLPPGWRLFHAAGVDDLRATWITRWSLLEIFLVLITTITVAQLWGARWGALALVTLALIYTEPGGPRWSWLALLAAQALLRVVPEGRLRALVRAYRLAAIAVLAATSVAFSVQQVRQALYPALEMPWLSVAGERARELDAVQAAASRAPEERVADLMQQELQAEDVPATVREQSASEVRAKRRIGLYRHYAPDPQAVVSTGPGLPLWSWKSVSLSWRGPVESAQQIRLILIPPWLNFALGWARVALVALLVLCVLDLGRWVKPPFRPPGRRTASAALALALGLGTAVASPPASADFPSPELLGELRKRLLEKPGCLPECAASPRLRLEVTPQRLQARMQVDAAWHTAVPLPGDGKHWVPERVLLDGQPARGLARSPDGRLWIDVDPGQHQVVLAGPLPEHESVLIPLPLKPRRLEASVSGWILEGLREGGVAEDNLRLVRVRAVQGAKPEKLAGGDLPPFVRVERRLDVGLTWRARTRVARLTPPGKAVLVEVPLLAGESVTSEAVHVEENRALVNMGSRVSVVEWSSVLEPTSRVELKAPDGIPWTEVWQLDASPLWHVDVEGIPSIHQPRPGAVRLREWRPWPGERVLLALHRPAGIDGRTLTIDRSALRIEPGLRASEVHLVLEVRSSRGMQHTVLLPEGAQLQSVQLDGERQPIRQLERRVVLPIHPGKQSVEISWRSRNGISSLMRTPSVDLGVPSVNAEIRLAVPADRWVLFVGGPRLGPAVLFWSLLSVALLVALGLGRLRWTPLGWSSWFLLLVGLTQVPIWLSLIVAGWLVALGWRRQHVREASDRAYDAIQILLGLWSLLALLTLLWAIQQGLLGLPDMQIAGNGSSGRLLRWYDDRVGEQLPSGWLVSVPLGVYRLAMLAWALWLARALVGWLRWGWTCFSEGGLWRPLRRLRVQA